MYTYKHILDDALQDTDILRPRTHINGRLEGDLDAGALERDLRHAAHHLLDPLRLLLGVCAPHQHGEVGAHLACGFQALRSHVCRASKS